METSRVVVVVAVVRRRVVVVVVVVGRSVVMVLWEDDVCVQVVCGSPGCDQAGAARARYVTRRSKSKIGIIQLGA